MDMGHLQVERLVDLGIMLSTCIVGQKAFPCAVFFNVIKLIPGCFLECPETSLYTSLERGGNFVHPEETPTAHLPAPLNKVLNYLNVPIIFTAL